MQTASSLPKKSLEERKVSFKGGRLKALGGKKEGLEAVASSKEAGLQGGHVVQKKAKGGGGEVGQRAEGGKKRCSSANLTRDSRESRFLITFFNHVF